MHELEENGDRFNPDWVKAMLEKYAKQGDIEIARLE